MPLGVLWAGETVLDARRFIRNINPEAVNLGRPDGSDDTVIEVWM